MDCSNSCHVNESLPFQPVKIFVRYPPNATAGIGMKISCYKFLCDLFKLWRQFLPCPSKRTRQRINPPDANIADKPVDFSLSPLIVLLLHIALEILISCSARTIFDARKSEASVVYAGHLYSERAEASCIAYGPV